MSALIALAPVAAELCAANCNDHSAHQASHHHHVSSDAASAGDVALSGVLHGCGETNAIVSESRSVPRPVEAAGEVTTVAFAAPADPGQLLGAADSHHGPPVSGRPLS